MPKVPGPVNDAGEVIAKARRHIDDGGKAEWGGGKSGHGKHRKNPCGYPPSAPANVAFLAKAVEAKTHLEFSARVKFDVVTTNEGGGPTKPDHYDVQLRVTDVGGTPVDLDDVTNKPKLHYRRASPPKSRRISAATAAASVATFTTTKDHGFVAGDKVLVKDITPSAYNGEWTVSASGLTATQFQATIGSTPANGTEFGTCEEANDWLHVNVLHLPRPKKWYWQARVRCVDRNNCAGDWTAWTSPVLPWTGADPAPPVPTGLTLTFDQGEKGRWDRNRAVITFNEVKNFDYPGTVADDEADVIAYQVVLQPSPNGSSWTLTPRKRKVTALDDDADATCTVAFGAGIKRKYYYRARVRTIDRYNRKSAWTAWTTAVQPNDTTPPAVPTGVVAQGLQDMVELEWDDNTDPADSELVVVDLAYYQAKVTTNASPTVGVQKFWRMREASRVRFPTSSYKKRYWLHVRSVDSSDNKSAWVTAGPVRPGRVPGVRDQVLGRVTGIDWSLGTDDELGQPGYALAGGGTNSILSRASSGTVVGLVEGEDTEGTVEMSFTTGQTNSETVVGMAMRATDVSNFIGATYDDRANQVRLEKWTAGVVSTLATYNFAEATFGQPDRSYLMKTVISGNQYQVYLDGTLVITNTNTSYSSSTQFGPYVRRGSALDNGSSRIDRFRFTALDAAMGVVIDDDFSRITSAPTGAIPGFSAVPGAMDAVVGWVVPGMVDDGIPASGGGGLGTATSGQVYTTQGVWEIEQTDTPFAIYGAAVALPMYICEAPDIDYAFVKSYQAADATPTQFGCTPFGGTYKDQPGLLIDIDRPTRFIVQATTNVQNDDADDHIIRFYVMARDTSTGTWEWSRQTNIWSQAYDAGNVGAFANPSSHVQIPKQRNGATLGAFFFPASPDAPVQVELAWGYTIGNASTGNNVAIRNQMMTVTAAYSPDYSESYSTTKRARWSRSNVTRAAYRQAVTTYWGEENPA